MSQTIHISSLLVTVHPAQLATIANRIAAMPVAELAHQDAKGKIIVTRHALQVFA